MLAWWVVALTGGGVAIAGVSGLLWRRRALRPRPTYLRVSADNAPVDPLLRSQLTSSLSTRQAESVPPWQAARAWASGTSHLNAELDDLHRQIRTLQTYVLDLDARYVGRAEAAWLTLETTALVISIAGGVSAAVWAFIDLAK